MSRRRDAWAVAPRTVRVMVWLLRVAAAWLLAAAALTVYWLSSSGDDAVRSVDSLAHTHMSDSSVQWTGWAVSGVAEHFFGDALRVAALIGLGVAAVLAGTYLILGRGILLGHRSARAIASVLTVLSLPGLMLGPLTWVWVALGALATGLAWTPASSAHLRSVGSPPNRALSSTSTFIAPQPNTIGPTANLHGTNTASNGRPPGLQLAYAADGGAVEEEGPRCPPTEPQPSARAHDTRTAQLSHLVNDVVSSAPVTKGRDLTRQAMHRGSRLVIDAATSDSTKRAATKAKGLLRRRKGG